MQPKSCQFHKYKHKTSHVCPKFRALGSGFRAQPSHFIHSSHTPPDLCRFLFITLFFRQPCVLSFTTKPIALIIHQKEVYKDSLALLSYDNSWLSRKNLNTSCFLSINYFYFLFHTKTCRSQFLRVHGLRFTFN